jgi:hypothetical protein
MLIELPPEAIHELRLIKQEEIRLLRQREELVKKFGLKYYTPHAKQDAFHRAGGRFKSRAVFAGNRFGKSDCGCAEDCAQALGHRPWLPLSDPARTAGIPQRPQKVLVITTDWGKVDEIFTSQRGTMGKVWKYLPQGFVKSKKTNHSGAIEVMDCENGSLIQFDTVESFKKNPQSAESSDWDVIHVDEPCPEKMFNAHARGLIDRDGQEDVTLTPLREPWIYDRFYGDQDTRSMVEAGGAHVLDRKGEELWSVTGSIWDNPYLSERAIARYLNNLDDPEERECREKGIPLQFAGLIYKEFETALHIMQRVPDEWDDFDRPPANWPVYLQLDPHPQTPIAGLLCTVSNTHRRYIFNEIWKKGIAKEIAKEVFDKIGPRWLVRALGDPSVFNRDQLTDSCQADDFGEHGLWLDRAVKDLDRGILAVKAALKERYSDGLPAWMVSPKCKRFIYEIKRWHWDKDNKPIDRDDHTLECFYRMVLDNPTWTERSSGTFVDPFNLPIEGLERSERWESRDYTLN